MVASKLENGKVYKSNPLTKEKRKNTVLNKYGGMMVIRNIVQVNVLKVIH